MFRVVSAPALYKNPAVTTLPLPMLPPLPCPVSAALQIGEQQQIPNEIAQGYSEFAALEQECQQALLVRFAASTEIDIYHNHNHNDMDRRASACERWLHWPEPDRKRSEKGRETIQKNVKNARIILGAK